MRQFGYCGRVVYSIAAALLLAAQTGFGQDWDAVFTIDPLPSPYISDWQTDPVIATLDITNNTNEQDVVIVDLEVLDENGSTMIRAYSRRMLVPPGQPAMLNNTEFMDWNVSFLYESMRNITARSGMFPEGVYEACVSVRNLWGTQLVPPKSSFFTIQHPEPPELIYPIDNEIVYTSTPVFQWIPTRFISSQQTAYIFRIAEIIPGQLPEQALVSNIVHYENFNVFDANLEYPLDAQPLEPGKVYAWQVQAVDIQGRPAAKNQGKSIVGTFSLSTEFSGDLVDIELVRPDNGAVIETQLPVFRWEPVFSEGAIVPGYELVIVPVHSGQSALDAVSVNPPWHISSLPLEETVYAYPETAPVLEKGGTYAWQVRWYDDAASHQGAEQVSSEVWMFQVSDEAVFDSERIPEKLPVLAESAAYLLLKRGGQVLVSWSASADSSLITLQGPMELVVPACGPADPLHLQVQGQLTYDSRTLDITAGSFQGSVAEPVQGPGDLTDAGAPLVLKSVSFDSYRTRSLEFKSVPRVFDTDISDVVCTLVMDYDGNLSGNIQNQCSTNIPLDEGAGKLQYSMTGLTGSVTGNMLYGMLDSDFRASGSLVIAGSKNRVRLPAELAITENGASSVSTGRDGTGDLVLDLETYSLELHDIMCRSLSYENTGSTWSYDLSFDMSLQFRDPPVNIPGIRDVHMSRFGIEIPDVSVTDLGTEDFAPYHGVETRLSAFRMHSYVFDWLHYTGGDPGDWGFFFDVDVRLPGLPKRMSELGAVPFRAVNVTFSRGRFNGSWNTRTFAPAVFAGLTDTSGAGFSVHTITGAFSAVQGKPPVTMGAGGEFIPGDALGIHYTDPLMMTPGGLALSPDGLFFGALSELPAGVSVQWSSTLTINTDRAGIRFSGDGGVQQALMDIEGSVTIPDVSGNSVRALGSGVFNLITRHMDEGEFIIQDGFMLGLPPRNPLFGVSCEPGAVIDDSGLHVSQQDGDVWLSSGHTVSCAFSRGIDISLPQWKISAGTILFQNTFALELRNFSGSVSDYIWSTGSAQGSISAEDDALRMVLPSFPRINGGGLVGSGQAAAELRYDGVTYGLDAEYSSDFEFSVSSASVSRGTVTFYRSGERAALLDKDGLHLGALLGRDLAEMKIGLPDIATAYIDMKDNPHLFVETDNGMLHVSSPSDKPATICFPSLQYNAAQPPSCTGSVDLLIDPSTMTVKNSTIDMSGTPLFSLMPGKVPVAVTKLTFESGSWKAGIEPVLPPALQGGTVTAHNIPFTSSGLGNLDYGFSQAYVSPAKSVVLGTFLTTGIEGFRIVAGGALPKVSFSGSLSSPVFGTDHIHFTAELAHDSARFAIETIDKTLPAGCAVFQLKDMGGLPRIEAPMNSTDFTVFLSGRLKLGSLSTGFSLSLPRIEWKAGSMKVRKTNTADQSLRLFGTDIEFSDFTMKFLPSKGFDLVLNGTMDLLGGRIPFTGLHVKGDCTIADTVLAAPQKPVSVNRLLSVEGLQILHGNLKVQGKASLPDPFSSNQHETFALMIAPSGAWLDDTGSELAQRIWKSEHDKNSGAPRAQLGDDNFSASAGLAALVLSMDGDDNSGAGGSVEFQVDIMWPKKTVLAKGDSANIQTTGTMSLQDSTSGVQWAVSGESPADTITTLLDTDLFMHASTFSMAATNAFQMSFNAELQLPVPPDLMNGQIELIGNSISREQFEFGQLHAGEVSIGGITLTLSDFYFVRDDTINTSEISFSETNADVRPETVHADLYFSFGASISADLPGFSAGVDRFVIFKNQEQFHLLIDNAHIFVREIIDGSLDLVGSIDKSDGTQFQWLLGGHLNMKMGDIKGVSAVGQIGYTDVMGVDGKYHSHPGFGLFLSVNTDIDLTPLPIKVKGAGAGFFWNPSKKVRDMVRSHLGFTEEVSTQFQALMDASETDMMTLWEFYLYGAAAVPDEKTLDVKALLTLATDRIRLDGKAAPADENSLKKVVDLTGWLTAECAWQQDFSAFRHLAGHIKIGGSPAVDKKYILKLPETTQATMDFIITGEGQFAMSGHILIRPLSCSYLATDYKFTFGNPGLVVSGSVSYGFDIMILSVEAGLDLTCFVTWEEPKKIGAYMACWIEGAFIDDWLAGFRGEMGAALMAVPDFYLYGYAELEGTILGVSKTVRAWAKWEMDGGMSAGTGADPTLAAIVKEAQDAADQIMGAVETLQAEMGMDDLLQSGGLTEQEVKSLIDSFDWGMGDAYYDIWKQEVRSINEAAVGIVNKAARNEKETIQSTLSEFINALNGRLNPTNYLSDIASMKNEINALKPIMEQIKNDIQTRNTRFGQQCSNLVSQLNQIDFELDTLLALTEGLENPIRDPLNLSYGSIEGVPYPNPGLDNEVFEQNEENSAALQKTFDSWLSRTEQNIMKIRKARKGVFKNIGPGGETGKLYEIITDPVLVGNEDYTKAVFELNEDFKSVYADYDRIAGMWAIDDALTILAGDEQHRTIANARRAAALAMLNISLQDLPSNPIDRYRVIGRRFFQVIPQVMLKYYIQDADSLLLKFGRYINTLQNGLDRQHRLMTSKTDVLWDKYAALSQQMYAVFDLYAYYMKHMGKEGQAFALADSAEYLRDELEKEFMFPTVTPKVDVSSTKGFLPLTITMDFKSDDPGAIPEYSAVFNGKPPQSFGDSRYIIREYIVRHGISYWYETSNREVYYPMTNVQSKTVTITPRFRNRAGLAAFTPPHTVELHGKDWKYSTRKNSVKQNIKPDSAFFRILVSWPYPGQDETSVLSDDGSLVTRPAFRYTSNTTELDMKWKLENRITYTGYDPLPAKHRIELYQGENLVYGPREVPVTHGSMPENFSYHMEGLNLKADTGLPVYAKITALDAANSVIGISEGTWTRHAIAADGTVHEYDESWSCTRLYIDTSPPVIQGKAILAGRPGSEGYTMQYKIPIAHDIVTLANRKHFVALIHPGQYEYQLKTAGTAADTGIWKPLKDSGLVDSPGGSGYFYIVNGPGMYADSLVLMLRAINKSPGWITGTSAPRTFILPGIDETEKPAPALFDIAGLDENKNILIKITRAGSDSLSGISRYPWRLSQDLPSSGSQSADIWNPDSLFFTPDQVTQDAVLTIPVPHEKIDVGNVLDVGLYTLDGCDNRSESEKVFNPGPITPVCSAYIKPGMPPFSLVIEGDMDRLTNNGVESVLLKVGSVPDSSDILREVKSIWQLRRGSYKNSQAPDAGFVFSWDGVIPSDVGHGETLYISLVSIRDSEQSEPWRQAVKIYDTMFETAETAENGNIILPITHAAFDGAGDAGDAVFTFGAGYYRPGEQGQSRFYFGIASMNSLPGILGADVKRGSRITLPLKAADLPPKTLIGLVGTSLNGETCFTYKEIEIVPPKPEMRGSLDIRLGSHEAFSYELLLDIKMGENIQRSMGTQGRAEAIIYVGSKPGVYDVEQRTVTLSTLTGSPWTRVQMILDDSIAVFPKIYVAVRGKTAVGKISADTTHMAFDVPWPEQFCRDAELSIEQKPMCTAVRHADLDLSAIEGYMFAAGSSGADGFDVRPYPDEVDITAADWKPGQKVTAPFSLAEYDYSAYRIGVRAKLKDGTFKENVLDLTVFSKAEITLEFIGSTYGDKLRIQGSFSPETAAVMAGNELVVLLGCEGEVKFSKTITVPASGTVDRTFNLSDNLPRAKIYRVRSVYRHNTAYQDVAWETIYFMPGKPLFYTVDADSQDCVYVKIVREGFNGDPQVIGYQYALGTEKGKDDIRQFPPYGSRDFYPDAVTPGADLVFPHTIAGLPGCVYVTLRAMHPNGYFHTTSVEYRPRPAMPKVRSLRMDQNGRFYAVFDPSSFDEKTTYMDLWIRRGSEETGHTIAFEEFRVSEVESGEISFPSTFTESVLGENFVFRGLNLGHSENSNTFTYRFIINKSGDEYQITPVN